MSRFSRNPSAIRYRQREPKRMAGIPVYAPDRFHDLIQRLARLEPGRYLITVTIPKGDANPDHTVLELGKVEGRKQ